MGSGVIDLHCSLADLINQFAIVIRTALIHTTSNSAFANTAGNFMLLVKEMIETDYEININLRGDIFYINGQRVRYSPQYMLNSDYLADQFEKRGVGAIIINRELRLDEIEYFIQSFIRTCSRNNSFDELEEKISRISGIELKRTEKINHEEESDARRMVRKTYFNAVFYIKGVMNKIESGEEADIKKAKKVVVSVVNTIVEHEQILLGMTAIKDYDEYTCFHCANVSILSLAMGQRLGLRRQMLIDLGIASLFHDLGKVNVPCEILNKPTRLVDAEWRIIKRHPVWGVKALLKMRNIDEVTIRASLVAFEHHMNLDHSGYPRMKTPHEIDLFSRIVSIADRYDAMTSDRVYIKNPMRPDQALSFLMAHTGDELDPLILKYFINMVGVYPIGTLVKLDSNELGLVFENNYQTLIRPRIILITDTEGNRIEGKVIDLTERNAGDEYRRTIIKIMNPKEYGINIAEYLL